ncbi:GNAT family N-acetyltransferase [Pedobacter gandavensis]|uniref:GNAT family N-acetyltransferase n=1 Tax=Pedobacter gandavensis TaxID=2679963 RepID=UPI0024784F17|nr:GNAT family N-acetyltransferase [Pedobacter gandavensis]WGQ12029.1 GNAT family N-acetyltransferase [Pedobacter gandavensis]
MIKRITAAETLPLRSLVLRNGMPYEQCIFPQDHQEGVFHLGCFEGEKLVTVATFFPEDRSEQGSGGFRLRGMASDPAFAGKGYGAKLIKFAIDELRSANAAYIWCNARSSATAFYEKLGFVFISEEFEVPGVGPHFDMLIKL